MNRKTNRSELTWNGTAHQFSEHFFETRFLFGFILKWNICVDKDWAGYLEKTTFYSFHKKWQEVMHHKLFQTSQTIDFVLYCQRLR